MATLRSQEPLVAKENFQRNVASVNGSDATQNVGGREDKVIETVNLDLVLSAVQNARANGGRIVMTNGCFDLLHVGHVRSLQEARSLGTHLLVAINSDDSVRRLKGDQRPIVQLSDRMEILKSVRYVDWVLPFGVEGADTPSSLISMVRPDVLAKGGDYERHEVAGAAMVEEYGGAVVMMKFYDSWSTTKTVDLILQSAMVERGGDDES